MLATAKQQVLELKAELEQAKAATRAVEEAAEAMKQASYDLGVQETKIHLVEELVEVCREYYQVTWAKALNLTGFPATSEWRKVENVYYPLDIREVPTALSPPVALVPTPFEKLPTT